MKLLIHIFDFLLKRFSTDENYDLIAGDIKEKYNYILENKGAVAALSWYAFQISTSAPNLAAAKFRRSISMLGNYIKTAFRNIKWHKTVSIINISGLVIGMAACFLILQYVNDELNYDKFNKEFNNIYRVIEKDISNGVEGYDVYLSGNAAEVLMDEIPEVKVAVKFFKWYENKSLKVDNREFEIKQFVFTNEHFFKMFDYELKYGSKSSGLADPNGIILTERISNQIFGNEDPSGKVLVDDRGDSFIVTGVIDDSKYLSHLEFDALVRWEANKYEWARMWNSSLATTYLLINENSDPSLLGEKILDVIKKYEQQSVEVGQLTYDVQPLSDIHLRSEFISNNPEVGKGDINYIYVFSAVAILILLTAFINFMNLTTANAAVRAKEVGLRKVIGAKRAQLIKQFLGESMIISTFSFGLAVLSLYSLEPVFGQIFGKVIEIDLINNYEMTLVFAGLALAIGLLAGFYPAFIISQFNPVSVFQNKNAMRNSGNVFRKFLVVFQFSVTVIMIISSLVIYYQLNYMTGKEVGFNTEQIIFSKVQEPVLEGKDNLIKGRLQQLSSVKDVSITNFVMGGHRVSTSIKKENAPDKNISANLLRIDNNYIDLYGMEIVEGRNFNDNLSEDSNNTILVNEMLVKMLDIKDPINKKILYWGEAKTIIGVVKDFHFGSFHDKIEPVLFNIDSNWLSYSIVMKVTTADMPNTLAGIEKVWVEVFPEAQFNYKFLDENIGAMYNRDRQTAKMVLYFAIIAITIACLGLFGLSSYTSELRTKEIGVRKVLGATTQDIMKLFLKEYSSVIVVANVIAWPVSYYFMNKWLENFAYRIEMNSELFLIGTITALVIAVAAISYNMIRSAWSNPVNSIRSE